MIPIKGPMSFSVLLASNFSSQKANCGEPEKKYTLQSMFMPSIDYLPVDGTTPPADFNHIKSLLHTKAVTKAIQTNLLIESSTEYQQ